MKNTFRTVFLMAVVAGLLFSTGCKKSNPSIIGSWTFTNVVANNQSSTVVSGNTTGIATSISYQAPVETITETTDSSPGGNNSVNLNGYALQIVINASGTYVITESYTYAGVATTNTTTGIWNYLSSTSSDDIIMFRNGGSILLSGGTLGNNVDFGLHRGFFTISSLSSNQLIISGNTSNTSSTSSSSYSETVSSSITFSR